MLSTENPPDPPCSCKVSGLRNDDRPSDDDDKLTFLNSTTGLVDDDKHKLPPFSIRDYVFTARHKNIGTNWPFPQKYLQLCLRHGIKDLLPPFEPPDLVRNRSRRSCSKVIQAEKSKNSSVEVGLHDEVNENVHVGKTDKNSSKKADHRFVRSLDQVLSQLPENQPEKLKFPDHVRDEEAPSTVTRREECKKHLVPPNTPPCPVQDAPTTLTELDVLEPPCLTQKNETVVETPGKKYRLIVKLGSISDPSRGEHTPSGTTTISEPMASKLCPVCKTFSSTSNTTLNAHIDQCLSVESNSKWAIDAAKLTKHRIKPRKMRSMIDIYVTAPHCTLEDLDRRNGTNWATDLSLINTEAKVAVEGKRKRSSCAGLPDVGDEGAVYFDSNGTKVRILSKFCDPSVSTLGEDSRPKKNVKDSTQSKTSSIDQKILVGPKHSGNLRPKIQNKTPCQPLLDAAGICGAPIVEHVMEKKQEKEESLSQLLKTRGQTTHSESGTLRQWVCSKRTGLLKKLNGKCTPKGLRRSFSLMRDPLVKNSQCDHDNSTVEGNHMPKFQNPPEKAISSPNSENTESVLYGNQTDSSGDKCSNPHENNPNQLISSDTFSADAACEMKFSRSSGKFSTCPRSKRIDDHADRIKNSDSVPRILFKPSQASQMSTVRSRKSSTLRNGLVVAQQSFPNSKSNKRRKRSTLKKSRTHRSISEMAEQVGSAPSQWDEQYDHIHDSSGNLSWCSNQVRSTYKLDASSEDRLCGIEAFTRELVDGGMCGHKFRKDTEGSSISGREDPMAMNSSLSGSEVSGLDLGSTVESQVRVSCMQFQFSDNVTYKEEGRETNAEILLHKDNVISNFPQEAVGRTAVRSNESFDVELQKTNMSSDAYSNSLQSTGEHRSLLFGNEPAMPLTERLSDNQVTCANDGGAGILLNTLFGLNANCRGGEKTCSSKVQFAGRGTVPLHIPGLLLLGPDGMGSSEDHQDCFSLASSRILHSQDLHVVDRDTSGSPVSARSTISHPLIARSDSNISAPESSLKPSEVQDKIVSGFYADSSEPVAGNASTLSTVDAVERMNIDSTGHGGSRLYTEEGSPKLSDDPSSCSQKESISLDASLTYQDSQISRQCAMSVMMPPAKEKQVACDLNNRPERNDKMVVPMIEIPKACVTVRGPSAPIQKLPSHGGFCSAGPSSQIHQLQSPTNPVLRLMGKNLMVVNKEEDTSVQITQPASGVMNEYTDARYCNLLRFSNNSAPSQDRTSLCHAVPEGFSMFRQDSSDPLPQCFGFNIPEGGSNPQLPVGNCNNLDMGVFRNSSLGQHDGFRGGIYFHTQGKLPVSRPMSSFAYDAERGASPPCVQDLNSVSVAQASGGLMREVIVIDDSPENDAESRMIYAEQSHRRQSSHMGNLPPTAPCSNLRHMSAFSCQLESNPFPLRELSGGSRSSFSMPCPTRGTTSPLKWGNNSDIPAVQLGSTFIGRTPFASHLCPTMHYSSSMS